MIKRTLLILIGFYRKNRFIGQHCRYYPSCSEYAKVAIENHGLLRAFGLIFVRLARCNQFFPGGYDPVPGCG